MAKKKDSYKCIFFINEDINNTKPFCYLSLSNFIGLITSSFFNIIFYFTMFACWDRWLAAFTCRVERFISHAEAKVFDKFHCSIDFFAHGSSRIHTTLELELKGGSVVLSGRLIVFFFLYISYWFILDYIHTYLLFLFFLYIFCMLSRNLVQLKQTYLLLILILNLNIAKTK